jgi:uncharacterized membrane protein YkoI
MRNKKILGAVATLAALGVASGVALAGGGGKAASPSRLDDGKDLLSQARITEQQAVDAAQAVASGSLNENDLEHYNGKLVYNVDVGKNDVKVDAATGEVLANDKDD